MLTCLGLCVLPAVYRISNTTKTQPGRFEESCRCWFTYWNIFKPVFTGRARADHVIIFKSFMSLSRDLVGHYRWQIGVFGAIFGLMCLSIYNKKDARNQGLYSLKYYCWCGSELHTFIQLRQHGNRVVCGKVESRAFINVNSQLTVLLCSYVVLYWMTFHDIRLQKLRIVHEMWPPYLLMYCTRLPVQWRAARHDQRQLCLRFSANAWFFLEVICGLLVTYLLEFSPAFSSLQARMPSYVSSVEFCR